MARLWSGLAAAALLVLAAAAPIATAKGGHGGHGSKGPVDLDVLFIGAHPDDEAGGLAVYGAWAEEVGARTGVITVTRGEGGGNAVGPEEGPPLGLLREDEERRAVGMAGIRNIYNLDKVDFYYTVSAPLTREVWGDEETLARVVRVVRKTRPEVIVTMNPSPTPGNHGHHQMAARYAVEAYEAAASPSAFPEQLANEDLRPWRVKRLFRNGATGTYSDNAGPECATSFTPAEATDETFGVWGGERAESGTTWAQIEREAQRQYASQGWSVFPDVPADPAQIGCDRFTQIDSRVPYTATNARRDAMLEGALVRRRSGLPLGTEFELDPDRFEITGGSEVQIDVRARGPRRVGRASVKLDLPEGWSGETRADLGKLSPRRDSVATLTVTAPDSAEPGRVRIAAKMRAGGRRGSTSTPVAVVPGVRGTLEPLPQVADFSAWVAADSGQPQLGGLVAPLASLAVGETRTLRIDLRNYSSETASGTVALALPAGFEADAASKPFDGLAAGGDGAVTFEVTNTDASLPTSNQGGDYAIEITTTTGGVDSVERAALNLVPRTEIPQAASAPQLDGVESPGEYPAGAIDLSRVWEGENPSSPADASGSAKLAWSSDALYMLVSVTDDTLGTVLPASDAKRHWRTDSVEIAVDPRRNSENTSSTYKVGVFPTTQEGQPAAYRDADNRQGPVSETSPGFEVASQVHDPYDGYTLEVKIPFAEMPAAVRPDATGLNVFIYDSDTQDKTGQTRLGWSTWGGVQGDPYRWGLASFAGYNPPPELPTEPIDPVFPRDAALSVDSPQSITQAANDGVALAGGPQADDEIEIVSKPRRSGNSVTVRLHAEGPGTAHVFATDDAGRGLGSALAEFPNRGNATVTVPLTGEAGALDAVAVAFEAADGSTDSTSREVR
jgi:LmbE family N-acetylglucosaminyl deacetylase